VLGAQVGSKLALAVIPNMSQTANTVMFNGFRNTVKGFLRSKTDADFKRTIEAVAWGDSIIQGVGLNFRREQMARMSSGIPTLDALGSAADRFAWLVLRFSGFNAVERWNRVLAGSAAQQTLRDTAAKALRGLQGRPGGLRGASLERARRQIRSMGIELDDAVQALARNDKRLMRVFEERAVFQGAQLTQFTPSRLRRPEFWSHPAGRVMFQFKNFALGQYRFLRDQVFSEAARGNVAPLAYFMSVYPVSGEVVKGVRNIITDKEREDDGVQRFVNDMLAVGGFGLFSDMVVQARFGRTLGGLAGPTISDMSDLAGNLAQLDGEGLFEQVRRQPLARAVAFGTGVAVMGIEEAERYMELRLQQDPSFELMDANMLRLDVAREKSR
jgi:hypothetical protein